MAVESGPGAIAFMTNSTTKNLHCLGRHRRRGGAELGFHYPGRHANADSEPWRRLAMDNERLRVWIEKWEAGWDGKRRKKDRFVFEELIYNLLALEELVREAYFGVSVATLPYFLACDLPYLHVALIYISASDSADSP